MAGTDAYRWDEDEMNARLALSNSDLTVEQDYSYDGNGSVRSLGYKDTGKIYWELYINETSASYRRIVVGWADEDHALWATIGSDSSNLGIGASLSNAIYRSEGVEVGTDGISGIATGDVIMVAADFATGKFWFGRNGTWRNGDPATGNDPSFEDSGYIGAELYPAVTLYDNNVDKVTIRTTDAACSETIPAGFSSLNGTPAGTVYEDGFTAGIAFTTDTVVGVNWGEWLSANIGNKIYRYTVKMTGGGQADYSLTGLKSISLQMQATYAWWYGPKSKLQIVLVYSEALVAAIALRQSADIVFEMAADINGVEVHSETIITVDYDGIRVDRGAVNKTIVLTGSRRCANNSAAVLLTGIVNETILSDGRMSYRCAQPHWHIRPGNNATYGANTIQLGTVTWAVSRGAQSMTLTEVRYPWVP